MVKKEPEEAKARYMLQQFAKGMDNYSDAVEVLNPLVIREMLPSGAKWGDKIAGDFGKHFRERVVYLAMNRWRVVHRRTAVEIALTIAAEHLSEAINCSVGEAKGMIQFEILDRTRELSREW